MTIDIMYSFENEEHRYPRQARSYKEARELLERLRLAGFKAWAKKAPLR